MELHHVGIVVDSLAEAIPLFEVWFGAQRFGEVIEDEYQGARIQLFLMENSTLLEVVEALPGGNFHHSGEFHLCFTVPDIDEEMHRMHDLGAVVSHPTINAAHFENRRMAFVATQSGQLVELLESKITPLQ